MICPECNSKLMVKDTREDGFIQIRLRVCQSSGCDYTVITEEKPKPYQNESETEILDS